MTDYNPTVFLVDDDEAVRDSLGFLMKSVALSSRPFSSADEFLAEFDPECPGCLVLDIRMPGMSGMELQQKLIDMRAILPIIFITGHGDIPMAVEAMQRGAVDFIPKPFRDHELLDRINKALEDDQKNRSTLLEREEVEKRIEELTPREKQVMELVVQGHANKVIAGDLDVSQRTVEIHRARVMEKMQARSLAQLVRMVMQIQD